MKTLFVALLAVFGSLQYCSAQQVYNPPVRWQSGTAAPSSGDCDSAAKLGGIYLQTGNPASVRTQNFSCQQTGASTFAWMPFYGKVQTTASATCSVGDLFFDSDATAGSNLFGCTSANTWTLMSGGGGSGTVTVVGAGSLTSTACVTGGGSQAIQTPSATCTIDSSGNISTPGGVSTGAGGSVAGYNALGAGSATAAATGQVGFLAPASVSTPFFMKLPAAPVTGLIKSTGTSDPATLTFIPTGTGVDTALGQAVSGTGAICLASGSACAGGGGGGTRTIQLSIGGYNPFVAGPYYGFNGGSGISSGTASAAWWATILANSGTPTLSKSFWIPDDYGSALKVVVMLFDTAGAGGSVQMDYGLVCWPSGSVPTATMANTSNTGVVAFTGFGALLQPTATAIGITGCSAGSQAIIQLARNNTAPGGSNMAGGLGVIDVKLTYTAAY